MGKHKLFRRKPGGNWYVWIKGERVSTGLRDRQAAERAADDLERRSADPTYRAAHETTLRAALRGFIDDRAAVGRSAATLTIYEQKGRHLVTFFGADLALARLERGRVREFVAHREGQGAAPHTVHKELGLLRAALRWARGEGLFPTDPAGVLPLGYSPRYKPRRRYLRPGDAWALVEAVATSGGQRQPLAVGRSAHVAYLLGTCARWGESVRAERGDVDLDAGTVRVRGTKTEGAERTIPIVAPARPLLEYALKRADGPGQRMFRGWGNHLRDLKRAAARAHLPPVSPNDLRRSLPSWCRQAGVPLELLAELLGHAGTKMVREVYGVPEPVETGRVIDRHLEAARRGQTPAVRPRKKASKG